MSELTLAQRPAVAQQGETPPRAVAPDTWTTYVLLSEALSGRAMHSRVMEVYGREEWEEPTRDIDNGAPGRKDHRMSQPIRAVYEDGCLRLLDPVHLTEGQEIRVLLLAMQDRVREALGDLVMPWPTPAEADVDEEALAREVEAGFRGQPPLSETILEERRTGP